MHTAYLIALGFGLTLLVASLVLGAAHDGAGHDGDAATGGGDHGAGDHGHGLAAWAPLASLRFWTFALAFGGGVGLALERLGTAAGVAAGAAVVVGWTCGAASVAVVRALARRSVSSALTGQELVGCSGTLLLPVAPGQPGKIRLVVKGQAADYIARLGAGEAALATGAAALVVAEEADGALLVAPGEM